MSAYYFKFFYQRFLASTQGWKDEAVGVYLRLLIYQFDHDGLPDDFKFLCSIAPSLKKHKKLIIPKFKVCEDGMLRNEVMQREFERSKNASEINSNNIKRRWQNDTDVLQNEYENDTDVLRTNYNTNIPITNKPEEDKSSSSNPPPLQNEVIQQTANKVFKDRGWLENIMMGHKINEKDLISWMAQFNATLTTYVVAEFSERTYKRLFGGWLNKQRANGYQLQNEKSILSGPPLKVLN